MGRDGEGCWDSAECGDHMCLLCGCPQLAFQPHFPFLHKEPQHVLRPQLVHGGKQRLFDSSTHQPQRMMCEGGAQSVMVQGFKTMNPCPD